MDLPVGYSYWIVLSADSEILSNHELLEAGDFRYVCLDATPRAEALLVQTAGTIWTIKSKVRPGLYLTPSDEYRFRVTRLPEETSLSVSYGKAPSLTCAIPNDAGTQSKLHLSTSFDGQFSKTFKIPSEQCEEALRLVDMQGKLARWIAELPAAVHAITIGLECGNRIKEELLLYWKGLEHITIYGDFRCNQLPTNLESSPGYERKDRIIERSKGHRGKAEFVFTRLGQNESEHWEVPANRVKISLLSPSGGSTEIEEGANIEIQPDDDRHIRLRTGGLLPIRLSCNDRALGEISNDKPLLSKFLSAIIAEYGRTGTLKAEPIMKLPGTKPWPVLHWCTPQTAKECRREESDPTKVIWLVNHVSIKGLDGLRFKLTNLGDKLHGQGTCFYHPPPFSQIQWRALWSL